MTEQQLRALGAFPDRCSELVSRICLGCGTATVSTEEWKRHGNCCGMCGGSMYRDECTRCRARCEGGESDRACASLAAFRATGQVAFPEKVAEAAKRQADAERKREKPPTPSPVPAAFGDTLAAAWRRYLGSLKKYAVLEGRSNRADVFSFLAGQLAGLIITSIFDAALFFLFATIIPTWALAVRRLHDACLSGKWLLLLVFWPISMLVLPVMLLWEGTAGRNLYGPPPD